MNRRSFLRGLLGATALVPLSRASSVYPNLYGDMKFYRVETMRVPLDYFAMSRAEWQQIWDISRIITIKNGERLGAP